VDTASTLSPSQREKVARTPKGYHERVAAWDSRDRGRLVGRPALGNGIVGLAAMNARRQAVLIMTSRQRARGMGGMIMEQAPFSQ
jgi:hypothetical protein